MNEQLMIYLWSISEGIQGLLILLALFLLSVPIGYGIVACHSVEEDEFASTIKKLFKKCYIAVAIVFLFITLIPSKQDLALIFLYPKIKQGVETTLVSPTAKKMVDVVNLYLDKQIKELK